MTILLHPRRPPMFRSVGWILLSALVALLPDCKLKPKITAPGTLADGVSADCTNWETTGVGPYVYENNVWGHQKAGDKFEQCLLERDVQDRTELGWTWNWPGYDASVFAYPEIIFGWKPWSGGKPTDERLPVQVARVNKLKMHYHVETEATGSYNLAPEIWLTRTSRWFPNPNPAMITAEVMFWMDYGGKAQPGGEVVARPTIAGIEYELWRADNFGAGGKWTYMALKSLKVRRRGTIDMHAVLRYLIQEGHVQAEHYISSIEFGNEVMGGTGTTWIRRYEIELGISG